MRRTKRGRESDEHEILIETEVDGAEPYAGLLRRVIPAALEAEGVSFPCEVDVLSGRYVIDAKSIMGIFSLDLSKPITLNIHAENDVEDILNVLRPYIV